MRPYPGGGARGVAHNNHSNNQSPSATRRAHGTGSAGSVPSASSSPFVSAMRDRRADNSHNDPTGLPALVREQPSATAPTVPSSHADSFAGDGASALSAMPALKPVTYAITDTTTRKELLGIVNQLQSALNERTDSVNLIQRNFTRLSGMYRRDREELERVSAELTALRQQQHTHSSQRDENDALQKQVQQLRDEVELAAHRTQVAEATHAAEVAVLQESVRTLRESLEDAQRALSYSTERSAQEVRDQQIREDALQTSVTTLQQATGALAREVGFLLQQIAIALGQSLSASSLSHFEAEASPAALSGHLRELQEPLLESIRGLRRQCAIAAEQGDAAEAVQSRASRRLERLLVDAEREDRDRLREAEAAQRAQWNAFAHESGRWWDARLQRARQAQADAHEALTDAGARLRQAHEADLAEHDRAHAATVAALQDQIAVATTRAEDAEGRTAVLHQQLVEGQARVQALLAENRRTAATTADERRAADALHERERAAWEQQHRDALSRMAQDQQQASSQRAIAAASAADTRDAQREAAHTAALAAQRAELEEQFRLSLEALRVEAERAVLIQSMHHMVADAEADERHHITTEEGTARADLHQTLHSFATRHQQAEQQQRDTASRYCLFALFTDEQRARCSLVGDQAVAFAAIGRQLLSTALHGAQQRTVDLTQKVSSLEAAVAKHRDDAQTVRTAQTEEARQHEAALAARAASAETEKARLEMLYTKLCTENGQLLSRIKEQKESMRTYRDRSVTQQQVAVAALHRLQAAEEASESSYSCPICFQLFKDAVTCVPCGHTYCKTCLEEHPRNRRATHQGRTSGTELMCPECGFCAVEQCVQTRALEQLAHTFQYKQQVLKEILVTLEAHAREDLAISGHSSSASSPVSQSSKSRVGSSTNASTRF